MRVVLLAQRMLGKFVFREYCGGRYLGAYYYQRRTKACLVKSVFLSFFFW